MPHFVPLLNERGQQFEDVVHLVVEEHFLLRRSACLHVVENALESLVVCLLAFELFQLRGSNLLEHGGVVCNEVAHLHETFHDADAYVDSRAAAQCRRQHRGALLREYSGHVAPPSGLVSQLRV